jgi:hypothetical protein
MSNIFNDLNKLVNTIDKVDKLLSEKPKRKRMVYITKRFTQDELDYLSSQLERVADFEMDNQERHMWNKLLNKLKH